jgi:hypothetical protein
MSATLAIPLLYLVASWIPATVGLVVGVRARWKRLDATAAAGVVLNALYLIAFVSYGAHMWEAWKGI